MSDIISHVIHWDTNFENDGDRVDPKNFEGMIYRIRATIWCNFYFKIQYTDVDLLDVNLVDDEEEKNDENRDPRQKKKMSEDVKDIIVKLSNEGKGMREIGRILGFHHSNITRFLKHYNENKNMVWFKRCP